MACEWTHIFINLSNWLWWCRHSEPACAHCALYAFGLNDFFLFSLSFNILFGNSIELPASMSVHRWLHVFCLAKCWRWWRCDKFDCIRCYKRIIGCLNVLLWHFIKISAIMAELIRARAPRSNLRYYILTFLFFSVCGGCTMKLIFSSLCDASTLTFHFNSMGKHTATESWTRRRELHGMAVLYVAY